MSEIQHVRLEMKPEDILTVERRLNYTFNDKKLLIRALTRKAFAQEQGQRGKICEDQEVYRILGDAVLKAVLVEMLIQQGYDSRESITKKKIDLESRESLRKMLESLDIKSFICLGAGEKKQDITNQSSVLGETFEALVAAVHVDSESYEKTKQIVVNLFSERIAENSEKKANQNIEHDEVSRIWMLTNICDGCFQSDVCATMKMCYFDINGDD